MTDSLIPALSVIMPVHNAAAFLKQSIESILNQTFTNFEFIIIDDGSIDESFDIISSYSDFRIRFFQNKIKMGIVYTLNRAIELSNASIIARMDADDISLPERLEKQYYFLKGNHDYSLVCSCVSIIDDTGKLVWAHDRRFNRHMYYDLIFKCVIPHPTVMCTKDSLMQSGKYKNSVAEDYDLWSRYIENFRIFKLDEVLLQYRQSSSSISQISLKQENLEAAKKIVIQNISKLIGLENIDDSCLECYMDNFKPILNQRNFKLYVKCFNVLKEINQAILSKENPNRNIEYIKEASIIKKEFILNNILSQMSFFESNLLLILTSEWGLSYKFIKRKIKALVIG